MQLNNVFLLPCIEWEVGGGGGRFPLGRVKGGWLLLIAKWIGFCIYNLEMTPKPKVKYLPQCFCSVTV